MFAPLFSENTAVQPGHRSATLCWLSGFRPHSSPDPFGATLPPGRGFLPPRWGGGRVNAPPQHGFPAKSRRGDPCGRPERRGRRSLRVSFRSTPPQPVGAIHESPAAATRRVFRCHPASGERHGGHSLQSQKIPHLAVGDFSLKLFVPIRRAETSDQSGGFTRWISSKIYQARVCPQGLPAKIPRFRRIGGFRYLSMTSAVRPTVFYSSFDKQKLGQFASGGSPLTAGGQRRPEPCPRRCRCTSRSS